MILYINKSYSSYKKNKKKEEKRENDICFCLLINQVITFFIYFIDSWINSFVSVLHSLEYKIYKSIK